MKAKRTKLEKREGIQSTLEGYRRFDYDYIPFGSGWEDPGENFDYTGKDRRIGTFLLRFGMAVLAPLVLKVAYGCKVVGRENLKAIGRSGAVCVSNHIAYLDTLFVRQAVGYFRSYHTMGAENNKTGLGGAFIRRGGMLPLSNNLTAMRNFNRRAPSTMPSGATCPCCPSSLPSKRTNGGICGGSSSISCPPSMRRRASPARRG